MPFKPIHLALAAFAAVLAPPALAAQDKPGPVLSHETLDDTENHLGFIGLIGLLGLFGLRRGKKD